jgi:uncharacterized protein YciI
VKKTRSRAAALKVRNDMLYHIYCVDKPGSNDIRMTNRPLHLEYMKQFEDKVLAAGPTLTEDGNGVGDGMTGSVFIIDFPDRSGADDFCVHDPYQKAGLFESTVIKPFRKVVPQD